MPPLQLLLLVAPPVVVLPHAEQLGAVGAALLGDDGVGRDEHVVLDLVAVVGAGGIGRVQSEVLHGLAELERLVLAAVDAALDLVVRHEPGRAAVLLLSVRELCL